MAEARPFLYIVTNMAGCAIGVSDYSFSCVVYAASEDEAKSWGIDVATEYARQFGLPPHAIKPERDEIAGNSFMLECDTENAAGADHVCNAGELPEKLR